MQKIKYENMPTGASESATAILRTRISHTVDMFLREVPEGTDYFATLSLHRQVDTAGVEPITTKGESKKPDVETDFQAEAPHFDWESLKLADSAQEKIDNCLATIDFEKEIFERWGLNKIQRFHKQAINLSGKPGTGKTHAAHSIASRLGRKIITVSYAELSSKYVGDGAKNVSACFASARSANALLFVDESDLLLGRRSTNVSQGSETAANSLTSQFLIELERHQGIVIFATNLLESYDEAFDSRMLHVKLELPDEELRQEIWAAHLPPELPLSADVDLELLAQRDELCGRDIRNAVVAAASMAKRELSGMVSQSHFDRAVQQISDSYAVRNRLEKNCKEAIQAAIRDTNGLPSDEPTTHDASCSVCSRLKT